MFEVELPEDLNLYIISYLPLQEFCSMRILSKEQKKSVEKKIIWIKKLKKKIKIPGKSECESYLVYQKNTKKSLKELSVA